ncbi:hypothetical protein WKK05_41510 (plasmid) [Nostoc sp. UHCC 0302]|uniref:hypothetical protein n=1 Tax=Nostoc sp. UHCC 0302 TaxID=3134896 RepID=UPI00311CB424
MRFGSLGLCPAASQKIPQALSSLVTNAFNTGHDNPYLCCGHAEVALLMAHPNLRAGFGVYAGDNQLLPHQESSFGIAPKPATIHRAYIRAIHLSLKGVSAHPFRRTARAQMSRAGISKPKSFSLKSAH